MPKAHGAKLLDQFGEGSSGCAKVFVDRWPDMVVDCFCDLLWTPYFLHKFAVRDFRQHLRLYPPALQFAYVFPPHNVDIFVSRRRPVHGCGLRQYAGHRRGEVVSELGNAERREQFLWPWATRPTHNKRLVVHCHQLLENLQIARPIVSSWKEASEDAGPVKDEWFAPLPVAAQCSQIGRASCTER